MAPPGRYFMTFSKLYDTPAATVADVHDGAVVLIGSDPDDEGLSELIAALAATGVRGLTCSYGAPGTGGSGSVAELVRAGCVARIISPAPFAGEAGASIRAGCQAQGIAVETVAAGALAERLRAAGAGIGGVFVPVGRTPIAGGDRETRVIAGVACVLETPLRGDFALLTAARADTVGNLTYRGLQRGWNAVMAPAARITIVAAEETGEPGCIDPELVITPGIFVNRIVKTAQPGGNG